jgi:hypothetical protein
MSSDIQPQEEDSDSKKKFLHDLVEFLRTRNIPFNRVPTLGHRELDLHKLYEEVTSRGGVQAVIDNKQWHNVVRALKLPSTCTNAAFALRVHYMKYLKDFEISQYGTRKESYARASPTSSSTTSCDTNENNDTYVDSDSTRSPSPVQTRSRKKNRKKSKRYHPYTSDEEEEEEIILVSDELWQKVANLTNPISALINNDGGYVIFSNHVKETKKKEGERDDILNKLSTEALYRYQRLHNIPSVSSDSDRSHLLAAISKHFRNDYKVSESQVIENFKQALSNDRGN